MANIAFTAYLPEILPQVPACADIVAVSALRGAAIDFCFNSLVWNEALDATPVSDTDFPYDVDSISGAQPVLVMSLSVDGVPIRQIALDALEKVAGWRDTESDAPLKFYQPTETQVVLYPRMRNSVSMVLRVAYAPTRTAESAPLFLFTRYQDALVSGALSRLMLMPGQPWSNLELGAQHWTQFKRAIARAAASVNKSFGRTEVSVAMRPFA